MRSTLFTLATIIHYLQRITSATREYVVYTNSLVTADQGRALCEQNGQTLATVTNTAERQAIGALMTAAGRGSYSVWVGLNDIASEGTWVWEDGTACVSSWRCIGAYSSSEDPKWRSNEPNNNAGGVAEDCAELYANDGDASMNDLPCNHASWRRYTACNTGTSDPTTDPTADPTIALGPTSPPTTGAPTSETESPTPAPTGRQCVLNNGENEIGSNDLPYIISGTPCVVSGDPHFSQWNGVRHDYQGQGDRTSSFYLRRCSDSTIQDMPFQIIGKHYRVGTTSVFGLEYVTLKLFDNYDNDEIYMVQLSSALNCWYLRDDATRPRQQYDHNSGICNSLATDGSDISIGNIFTLRVNKGGDVIYVDLVIEGECTVTFAMNGYYYVNGRNRMHTLIIQPPTCYRCFICGQCGDFKTARATVNVMETCNGGGVIVQPNWSSNNAFAYDLYANTFDYDTCNTEDPEEDEAEEVRRRLQIIDGGGLYVPDAGEGFEENFVDPCDDLIKDDVIIACALARDEQEACCDILGDECDTLQEDCEVDACARAEGNVLLIDQMVQEEFTDKVDLMCNITETIAEETGVDVFAPENTEASPNATVIDGGNFEGLCDDEIGTFNWDTLTGEGVDIPGFNVTEFYVDESDLSLIIQVELDYLGAVTGDDEDEANFGVTYVLDFEDFDAHQDDIDKPGTCQNRNESAFDGKSWSEYWTYCSEPLLDGNIGSDNYLSYPPPDPISGEWSIYMKEGEECSTVVYEGKFSWKELRECEPNGGGDSYTSIDSDDNWLNLTGTFYINVVSPFWYSSDFGYYRVYQLLSQPFIISISSTVYVLGSTGINLMTLSVVAVYKEDDSSDFKLVLMTETADYMMLERTAISVFEFDPSDDNGNNFNNTNFVASTDPENSEGCLSNKDFICTQLWEISASNIGCIVGAGGEGTDFSGTYSLGFTTKCIDNSSDSHCSEFVADHPDLQNEISLSTDLFWKDDICDPEVFTVQFVANMAFYSGPLEDDRSDGNDEYQIIAGSDHLYEVGEDRIYVEIETEFPSETLEIFNTELVNVWICTFSPDISVSIDMDNLLSSGCLSSSRDSDYDIYFYNIYYSGDAQNAQSGFTVDDEDDTNIVRFSFNVPYEVARDTLYVHAQIEVELSELEGPRRRILLDINNNDKTANKIQHFGQEAGINHNKNHHKEEPNNNEYRPQEQPNKPQPEPQFPSSPLPSTATWTINLSSPWLIGIGAALIVVLSFNIIYLCYINCCNHSASLQRRGRRNGYSSVKPIDSEYDDSESPIMQNQDH